MLLFIYAYFQGKPRIVNFNTSHVTVYPGRTENVRHLNEISIHLMLLFIVKVAGHKDDPLKFQYISCYCLSIPSADIASVTISFQYISCYCLSKSEIVGEVNLTYFNTSHVTVYPFHTCIKFFLCEFQYISCYCLSHRKRHRTVQNLYFNTSHVTVYRVADALALGRDKFQYISCYCLSMCHAKKNSAESDFNTSHVTVYRHWLHTAIGTK